MAGTTGPAMAALLEDRRVDPDEVSAAANAISAGTETVLGLVERLGPLLTHSEVRIMIHDTTCTG